RLISPQVAKCSFPADAWECTLAVRDNAGERRPSRREARMTSRAASRSPGADRRRPQLPADVSGFVGRRGELARLAGLLDRGRLGTVAGPGGVGKTRLALRAAAAARPGDGSCLVELSGLTDPELLPDTVAQRLGLRRADAASR